MSDEPKEKAETPQSPPEKPESESEEKSKDKEGEHIDYKTRYEEERKRRERAESIIQRHKEKEKDEESFSETVDYESMREMLREEVDILKSSLISQLQKREISEAINKITHDPNEAALIRYHFDNSIRQTNDLDLDIENARALANKHRLYTLEEEIKLALAAEEAKTSGSAAGQKPKIKEPDEELPLLTPVDMKIISDLRQTYIISNAAIKKILAGESLDSLITTGVIKKR